MASNQNHICEDELSKLPKEKWSISPYLYWYQNTWCPSNAISNLVSLQSHFEAQDTDIILATKPKSGTTWLKALAFAILHRKNRQVGTHPLLSSSPQVLVPFLEYPPPGVDPVLHLSKLDSPRLLATHIPYSVLPESIRSSEGCRIVYLCRNPFDTIVSFLKFKEQLDKEKKEEDVVALELEECVDSFCRGIEGFGPHWDHVLGYWNASLKNPDKVLFLKYEDLKADIVCEIKRLAQFLGAPFTPEEEEIGIVDEIIELCSFKKLKELEVNKSDMMSGYVLKNSYFFRKGEVGDWKNYIKPILFDRLSKLMEEKFHGTGLTFKASLVDSS